MASRPFLIRLLIFGVFNMTLENEESQTPLGSVPEESMETCSPPFKEKAPSKWEWPLGRTSRSKRKTARPRLTADRRPLVKLTQTGYLDMLGDLGQQPFTHEKAGLLLGPVEEDDLVTHYEPDTNGEGTPGSFTLDAAGLNETLARYKNAGLNCKGVVHVHPPGVLRPSFGDLIYVGRLFANPKNAKATQIILPIVCNGRLYPYVIDSRSPREVLVSTLVLV